MRVVFIGTGEIGVPTLKAVLNSEHQVVGVVTQPDKPVGREQKIEPPPIKTMRILQCRGQCSVEERRVRRGISACAIIFSPAVTSRRPTDDPHPVQR